MPSQLDIHCKTFLAKGKRGIAFTAILNRKKVLVKERNPAAEVDTIANEAVMLQLVNTKKIGPLYIALSNGSLIREFIDGPEFLDWARTATRSQVLHALLELLQQCKRLDVLGVNKLELTHPHKHILMRRNLPVMIDFDRARFALRPKNVTQLCQWISGKELSIILINKDISIDRSVLLSHAKSYKVAYDAAAFRRIMEVVRNA